MPSRSPASSLRGHALRGAWHHHVERCECCDATDAESEHLGAAGDGDSDGHDEACGVAVVGSVGDAEVGDCLQR